MKSKICNNDSKKRSIIHKTFVFGTKMLIFLKFSYCFYSIENIKLQTFSVTFILRFLIQRTNLKIRFNINAL